MRIKDLLYALYDTSITDVELDDMLSRSYTDDVIVDAPFMRVSHLRDLRAIVKGMHHMFHDIRLDRATMRCAPSPDGRTYMADFCVNYQLSRYLPAMPMHLMALFCTTESYAQREYAAPAGPADSTFRSAPGGEKIQFHEIVVDWKETFDRIFLLGGLYRLARDGMGTLAASLFNMAYGLVSPSVSVVIAKQPAY